MSAELVKRLRGLQDDLPYSEIEFAADRIEQLERELSKLELENRELKMQAISDDAQYQMLAEQLAAEKALADRLYDSKQYGQFCPDADEAYRKARGL